MLFSKFLRRIRSDFEIVSHKFSFQDKMRSPHIILKETTQNLFKKINVFNKQH